MAFSVDSGVGPGESRPSRREGLVVRTHSNICYVLAEGRPVECVLRGRLKREDRRAMVGDRVLFADQMGGGGVIEDILPRTTVLVRPPVANVDQAIVVFTIKRPDLNPPLLDRFLVVAERAGLRPVLCLNKVDLTTPDEVERMRQTYLPAGYEVLPVSAKIGQGLDRLRAHIGDHVSVLAGPSGVGKSTLLNALVPGLSLRTGEVSAKIQRGTHTTRHVELVRVEGLGAIAGAVADTPGFTGVDVENLAPADLAPCFPELERLSQGCRFQGCLHYREPDCAVKAAAGTLELAVSRYQNYVSLLEERLKAEKNRYHH